MSRQPLSNYTIQQIWYKDGLLGEGRGERTREGVEPDEWTCRQTEGQEQSNEDREGGTEKESGRERLAGEHRYTHIQREREISLGWPAVLLHEAHWDWCT